MRAKRCRARHAAALAAALTALLLAARGARAFSHSAPTALLDPHDCTKVTADLVRCIAESGDDMMALDDCGEWTGRSLRDGAEIFGLEACAAAALAASADPDVLRMLVNLVHVRRAFTPGEDEDEHAFAMRLLTTQPQRHRSGVLASLDFVDRLPGARDNDALQEVLEQMAAEEEAEYAADYSSDVEEDCAHAHTDLR